MGVDSLIEPTSEVELLSDAVVDDDLDSLLGVPMAHELVGTIQHDILALLMMGG
jgi:hypothetical protein